MIIFVRFCNHKLHKYFVARYVCACVLFIQLSLRFYAKTHTHTCIHICENCYTLLIFNLLPVFYPFVFGLEFQSVHIQLTMASAMDVWLYHKFLSLSSLYHLALPHLTREPFRAGMLHTFVSYKICQICHSRMVKFNWYNSGISFTTFNKWIKF